MFRIQFTGIDEGLNTGRTRGLEPFRIVRIYVAGKAKPVRIVALNQKHHRRAGALGDHVGKLVQMLRAPGGDRVWKLGETGLTHQMDVLDLDIAGRLALALEQNVDPAVLAVFHFRALVFIARELRHLTRPRSPRRRCGWDGWC